MKHKLLLVFFMLFVLAGMAQKRIVDLNDESSAKMNYKNSDVKTFISRAEVKQARPFAVNKALKSHHTVMEGDIISLNLFDGKSYSARVEMTDTDINGTFSLTARLIEYPTGYCIITTSKDGYSSVFVDNPEQAQMFTTEVDRSDNMVYLLEINSQKTELQKYSQDLLSSGNFGFEAKAAVQDPETSKRLSLAATKSPDEAAVIDIMIVYTPAFKKKVFNIQITLAEIMTQASWVLNNSKTGLFLRLAYAGEIAYESTGNGTATLNDFLQNNYGLKERIDGIRNSSGADLVLIMDDLKESEDISLGLKNNKGEPEYSYVALAGATSINNYGVIHGIGHLLGAGHYSRQTTQPGPQLFPYSSGWRWKNMENGNYYCTVMTYQHDTYPDGFSTIRIPYFSNPDIYHMGYLIGQPTEADNARTIREMKHIVAAYRNEASYICPTAYGLKALAGSDEALLSWEPHYKAEKFTIEYKVSGTTRWSNVVASTNPYILTNLKPNTAYDWRIKGKCIWAPESNFSETQSFKTEAVKLCSNNYEPNETMDNAYPIDINTLYSAGIGSNIDEDYYKFEIDEYSNIAVDLRGLKRDYDMSLRTADGRRVGLSASKRNPYEVIRVNNLAPGTYYIRIYGYRGQYDIFSCYQLQVTSTPSCPLLTLPKDPLGAYVITPGANNVWFEVIRPANCQNYSVEYKEQGTNDWVMASESSVYKYFMLSGLSPETSYKVRLKGACSSAMKSKYFEFDIKTIRNRDVVLEPNNTIQSATPVDFKIGDISKIGYPTPLIEYKGDEDYYKFELDETSNIKIELKRIAHSFCNIVVLNDKGVAITSAYPIGRAASTGKELYENMVIQKNNFPAGTYYFKFYSENNNYMEGAQQANIKIEVTSSCRAPLLTLDLGGSKPDKLEIGIDRQNTVNRRIEYRTKGSLAWINFPVSSSADRFTISGLVPSTTYQVRVMGACSRYVNSTYREYEFTTKAAHPALINYEPNYNKFTAYPIGPNMVYEACIGDVKDQDYYKFTLSETSIVVIDLKRMPKDYNMFLYTATGSQPFAIASVRGNRDKSLVRQSLPAGTYYLMVYGYSGAYDMEASYTLTLTTAPVLKNSYDDLSMEQQADNVIVLYPNPVEHTLYIKGLISKEGETSVSVRIFNQGGKLMKTPAVDIEDASIDVSSFSPGVYFLHIDGKTYKFIKK